MKTRESGMPPEDVWQQFFDPQWALRSLGLTENCHCAVDLGCGYGTFSVAAAQFIHGRVWAVDIEPAMIASTRSKAVDLRLSNLHVQQRDFVESGCGLADGLADYVMLFNILHAEESDRLLAEVARVLRKDGILAVMHWNHDARTPRGPSMDIRPTPNRCRQIVEQAGFQIGPIVDLPPYHYGFIARLA